MIQGLYAITSEDLMPGELLLEKTAAALLGGCRLVQYRNKTGTASEQLQQAAALRELCDRYGASLIINDSVELALAAGAHGVHLGQQDSAVAAAREQLGPEAIIGATCHASLELATKACHAGASYLAFGRFYPSRTKPLAPPAPLALLSQVKQALPLPTVAIGGIHVDNAPALITAGADCLAVCHDLFRDDDPARVRQRAAQYVSLFATATAQEPQ